MDGYDSIREKQDENIEKRDFETSRDLGIHRYNFFVKLLCEDYIFLDNTC